ncbi:uncharacterized protein [Antedon mediterranea]|uniref:uncharacterized protein n=1 Tax=Antedon mediterranea TaxID=105859 RepID=UPI003AF9172D
MDPDFVPNANPNDVSTPSNEEDRLEQEDVGDENRPEQEDDGEKDDDQSEQEDDTEEDDNNVTVIKRHKRPETDTWNQNICKRGRRRLEGKAYKNRKGIEKPEKKMGKG